MWNTNRTSKLQWFFARPHPSQEPTARPSGNPTLTAAPTLRPTLEPSSTGRPSGEPSEAPTPPCVALRVVGSAFEGLYDVARDEDGEIVVIHGR